MIGKTNFLNKIITDTFNNYQSNKKIIIWGQKSLSPRITSNKYKNISELVSENFFIVKFGQTVYELLYLGKYQCVLNYGLSDIDKNICDYLSRNNLIKFLCPEKLDEYFINYKEEYLNFIKSRKQILLNNKAKLKIDEFIFSP